MNQPTDRPKVKVTKANVTIIAEMLMWRLLFTFGAKAVLADRQKWREIDEWTLELVNRRYTFGYSVTCNDLLREVMFLIDEMLNKGEVTNVPE